MKVEIENRITVVRFMCSKPLQAWKSEKYLKPGDFVMINGHLLVYEGVTNEGCSLFVKMPKVDESANRWRCEDGFVLSSF